MTNREYLQTLDDSHFLKAVNAFYFRYPLWTEDTYMKIPDNNSLELWLNKSYNSESIFWKYVLED